MQANRYFNTSRKELAFKGKRDYSKQKSFQKEIKIKEDGKKVKK